MESVLPFEKVQSFHPNPVYLRRFSGIVLFWRCGTGGGGGYSYHHFIHCRFTYSIIAVNR